MRACEHGYHGDCEICDGPETGDQLRWRLREQAIENTGYRSSGSEMSDTMSGNPRSWVVDDEYRRLCRMAGITAECTEHVDF